jgi:23S rRNA (cytidine1920-2'-O)/16S rRNA (cytidine1409-2'-O)-methyltransferase
LVKRRIDTVLVERELVESRAKAQGMIMAGEVLVDGKEVTKAGTLIDDKSEITIVTPSPFVSRGGIKLDYALERFNIDVSNKVIADIGASTGGFTDCMLQRGAGKVYAIDVGYGQLDYRLRKDSRVVVMERVNARYDMELQEKVDLAAIDVSFISVEKVIPSVFRILKEGSNIIVLIKPQFEAKKEEVGKGGVIKKPLLHATVLGRFIKWLVSNNYQLLDITASPIPGATGNIEFFVFIRHI